jgi:hypothetical protein
MRSFKFTFKLGRRIFIVNPYSMRIFICICLLLGFLNACSQDRLDISKVKREEFNILPLDSKISPYSYYSVAPLKPSGPVDGQGIPLYLYKDQGYFYHPVFLFQKMLRLISSFIKTGKEVYLERADLYARKMVELADEYNGALFFPYEFNNKLKGKKPGEKLIYVKAPWYSGMAQGHALSVFSRLYCLTKKKEYLEIARKIFKSFLIIERKNGPWIVYVDKRSYLWIEECPVPEKVTILNGFIFGIYGIYDYYQATKDELSKALFQAAVTTVKRHLHLFRNKGDRSWYSLGNSHKTTITYHNVHISQLKMLYSMTGDEFFKNMAWRFYKDAH